MPLILRNTKGSPLTNNEVDGNFTYLDSKIDATQQSSDDLASDLASTDSGKGAELVGAKDKDGQPSDVAAELAAGRSALATHKSSGDHDDRYLRKDVAQSAPLLEDIPQSGIVHLPYDLDQYRAKLNSILYPTGTVPIFDQVFSHGASMLDPRVDFSRPSTATYTDAIGRIRTAAIDEPRFTYDPVTGESLGLLVEGQVTNLLLWSEDLTNSHYQKLNGAEVISSTEGDDGSVTHTIKITGDSTSRILCSPALTGHTTLTYLCEIRKISGPRDELICAVGRTGGSTINHTINLTSEWQTVKVTFNLGEATAFSGFNPIRAIVSADSDTIVEMRKLQLETGSVATSYIPTEGSQVTRAADSTIIPTNAFPFNWRAGTLVFDRGDAPYAGQRFIVAIGESNSNYLGLDYNPTNIAYFQPFVGSIPGSNSGPSDPHKYAASWEVLSPTEVSLIIARDGVIVSTQVYEGDTSLISQWDKVSVGSRFGANVASSLLVKGLTIYPRALSDAELQALTS